MTLTQLAAGLPVDVMPGEGDPASAALPQQPLHRFAPLHGIPCCRDKASTASEAIGHRGGGVRDCSGACSQPVITARQGHSYQRDF
jgi:hypothetical protein